jgi:putative transposase
MASRGIPKAVYLDNGSAMVSRQLLRACAVLGIRLIHSTVRRPEGRGKIERFFRTVRDEFLVELPTTTVADLGELNRLFTAWLETVYHRRSHSETGEAPIDRFDTTKVKLPTAGQLREAFLWSETRTVTKTATVSLHSNDYQVDAVLVGRKVELVFDPFDLTDIEVRLDGRPMGAAVPHRIGRHSHPAARPDPAQLPPAPSTGIDYLRLVEAQRDRDVADAGGIDYQQLSLPDELVWNPKTTNTEEDAR